VRLFIQTKPKFLLLAAISALLLACGGGGGSSQSVSAPVVIQNSSVSGVVLAAINSVSDSDVNDPSAFFSSNDSFVNAQLISNLTTLGGYLNQAGQGQLGRSFSAGDDQDFYEVDLQPGQSINLIQASLAVMTNIDLTLFDENQMIVDQSLSVGGVECVENNSAGKHFVRANILQGAANYTLSVTSLPCSAILSSNSLRLKSDFAAFEMLIQLDTSKKSYSAMSSEMGGMGMTMTTMTHDHYAHVVIDDMTKAAKAMSISAMDTAHIDESMYDSAMTLAMIAAMQNHDAVVLAEPNYIYTHFAIPNDPFFNRQWHYSLISLPSAFDQAVGGSGAIVAVLDTGVLLDHPDLSANLLPGFDFISNQDSARDGDGIDADASDPGDNPNRPSTFHGSHVLGTVAAVSNNNEGVAGAAFFPNIQAMPVRVLGVGGGSLVDICEGLRFAVRLPNASNTLPANSADVINMSLGGPTFSRFLQDCTDDARAQGAIVVAAAGNAASAAPIFPAANNGVVSVSAVDLTRDLANYSNFGNTIDVAAPGGEASDDDGDGIIDGVFSTIGNDESGTITNTFGYLIGTSMATPHVSAVAALMKSVAPSLTPNQFDALLSAGELSDDLGAVGRDDRFGNGLINANRAVLAAQGMSLSTPLLSAAPSGLSFGLNADQLQFDVINVGGGDLSVDTPSENSGGWLSVSAPGGSSGGVYTVTVDRNHALIAAPGSYSAIISLTSNAGSVDLPVSLQVLQTGQSATADVGRQNVLLVSINADSALVIEQVISLDVDAGGYQFRFDGVEPGRHFIITTSDHDNDGRVCDTGEACGAFGSVDELLAVVVNEGSQIELDSFVASFNFAATASATSLGSVIGSSNLAPLNLPDAKAAN